MSELDHLELEIGGHHVEARLPSPDGSTPLAPVDGPRWEIRIDGGDWRMGPSTWSTPFKREVERESIIAFMRGEHLLDDVDGLEGRADRSAPVSHARGTPGARSGEARARPEATRRVLVVDDNRDAADTLSALVGILGHEVSTAYGGAEAVEMAAAFRPDAALLDIGMPGEDGFATARRLRAQPGGDRPLLVAVTAWDQYETRQLAVEAGFDYYLVKPANPETLAALLRLVRA